LKRTARSLLRVGAFVGAGATVGAGACIPDLPADHPSAADAPPSDAPLPDPATCGDGYIDLAAGEECDPPQRDDGGSLGCSDQCKVVCSGLKWSLNDHCYELMAATASSLQDQAGARCASFRGGGHVVTFASEGEFDAVTHYLTNADAGSFWVGLWEAPDRFNSVNAYEPGWSPTCPGCYAHTADAKAPLPRSREAIADEAAAGCVEAFPDPSKEPWLQYPCSGSAALRVVCEHEPEGVHSTACDAGTCINLVATYPAKTYVYESVPLAWTDAAALCRGLGGTLVVLQSRDEREQLWLELSRLSIPPPRIWIGLSPAGSPDASTWIWDDGTNVDAPDAYPSPWGIAQPSASAPAFLSHTPTQPPVDDTLARADPTVHTLPYVCQIVAPSASAHGSDANE
jgi:hypothetical protein